MHRQGFEFFRYLPASQKDRDWGLYVTGAGRIVDEPPNYDFTAHPSPYYYCWDTGVTLPCFAMIYVTRGTGEFESELTGVQTVDGGNVFLVFPGVWHRYRPFPNTPWTRYWVAFGGDYADRLVRRGLISRSNPILATGLNETVFHSYRSLLDRIKSQPVGVRQLIAANTIEALGAALAAAERRPDSEPTLIKRIEQARNILEEHLEASIDIEQLAASIGLSYDRFRHVFRQQFGVAPRQYHIQLRINRAKDLLAEAQLSVCEIATSLGFADASHFSNLFRRKVGVWPGQWRTRGDADGIHDVR